MTVTVGFAPSATPGLISGAPGAAQEEQAPEGLFAALLARLDANAASGDEVSAGAFGALIQTLLEQATSPAPEPKTELDDETVAEANETSETASVDGKLDPSQQAQGKSLLKTLGDALVALSDAQQAGKPVDPALEKKLNEALDAVAVYLGVFTPPTAIDPRLSALANGEHVLPVAAPATPPPAAPPVAAPPATRAPAAPAGEPAGAAPPALPEAAIPASQPAADAALVPEAKLPAAASDAPPPQPAPAALQQLGMAIGKLADKLATENPDLAGKLAALADSLKSGDGETAAAALGLDDAAAEPELERILAALGAARPSARTAEAKPFAAPTLALPDGVTAPAAKAEAPAAPPPTPKLETPAPEIGKPTASPVAVRIEKPEPADARPAPTQAASPPAGQSDAAALANGQSTPPAPPVAAARIIHAAYQAPLQQVNVPQVAFEVARQFEAGNSRFQIRLDPPELGRIDVKLDVDKSGTVNARLTVERPETLDLMQRDQRALQQALQQAGLDGQKTNLEFSLRQNPFAQQGGAGDGRGDQSAFNGRGDSLAGGEDMAAEAATTTHRGSASASGLNLFV
ncbi:flagellar hook-length control protein FliK [Devosia sp. A16]|uniref:flagellar hook-length control protein FliK n=1 Tax=Devosia sp. A16 TaxID=1736675 RepID=UPI0012E2C184|nr:flagellar hook-length control protein FliK [Devosia sp. A16]